MGTLRHSRRLALACATLVTLIAWACAGPASPSPERPSVAPQSVAPSSTAPSASASAPAELVVGGDRPVTVQVPASYDASRPAPLLIVLHGYTGSGQEIDDYFGVASVAEARGFVYASPDGTIDTDGNRFWNATDACCNFDRRWRRRRGVPHRPSSPTSRRS